MYRLSNIKIRENLSNDEVIDYALKKYKIDKNIVKEVYIYKKSIDARDKNDILYNYSIDVELSKNVNIKDAKLVEKYDFSKIDVKRNSKYRPVIIGAGPAGLFCALILIENGLSPIIIEQGSKVEKRIEDVKKFTSLGILNSRSNVQFGEGGAGTFSDGKLTTGNSSSYSRKVLEEFVRFGAPEEILYVAKPHIGTDNLVNIVRNIREHIISKGGTFLFDTKVVDLEIKDERITAVLTEDNRKIETDSVVLAIGHSARDTFKKLLERGLKIIPKSFAVGVRIEHLQDKINIAQYGLNPKLKLPPAEYKLIYHASNGRVCYTFCMCPGGQVIASSSQENTIVTNGMSKFNRDEKNANSALLVNVNPEDCENSSNPLCGMYFQEELEKRAFKLAGENYYAPIQRLEDYLNNKKSEKIGNVIPTYMPGYTLSNLNELFPDYINDTLKESIINLDKKLKGFADSNAILTAPETRTSSPVQIVRDNQTLNSNIIGIYPCGEGAGYAGGIMTAATDGIKVAIKILEN